MKENIETQVIHAGQKPDESTGAIMTPIFATSTYVQESPAKHKGYEYSRTGNPTREALEKCLAVLENGACAFAFASGIIPTWRSRHCIGLFIRRHLSFIRKRSQKKCRIKFFSCGLH